MIIGTLQVKLFIPESNSLKRKRYILKGIFDSIKSRYNVSCAELDHNDLWQSAVFGIAIIGNSRKKLNSVLDRILNCINADGRVQVVDTLIEFL